MALGNEDGNTSGPAWSRMLVRALTRMVLLVGVLLGALALVVVPGAALAGAVCGAAIGVLVGMRIRRTVSGDEASRTRSGKRGALVAGSTVTGGWVVLTGAAVLGGLLLVAVLLLLGAVAFVGWWWRRSDRGRVGPSAAVRAVVLRVAQDHPEPIGPDGSRGAPARSVTRRSPPARRSSTPPLWFRTGPENLTTPQLCLAWHCTYFALVDLPQGAPTAGLVELRVALLDEIERRDPVGFARWLDTGARAGSDPGRYLT